MVPCPRRYKCPRDSLVSTIVLSELTADALIVPLLLGERYRPVTTSMYWVLTRVARGHLLPLTTPPLQALVNNSLVTGLTKADMKAVRPRCVPLLSTNLLRTNRQVILGVCLLGLSRRVMTVSPLLQWVNSGERQRCLTRLMLRLRSTRRL